MSRLLVLWSLLLAGLFLPCGTAATVPQDVPPQTSVGAPAPDDAARFDAVPDFSFTERSGKQLTRADLDGAPWVAVPFFLRCTGPCPSITRDLRARLHDELAGTDIKIVSFSVDPTKDTVESLAEYADSLEIDPDRWYFVRDDSEEALHGFLNDGLKVPVVRVEGETDPGLAINHGTRMALVDAEGVIAGWYELADPSLGENGLPLAEADAILSARYELLIARARALAGLPHSWVQGGTQTAKTPSKIPLINACLNGSAFLLLIAGMLMIKRGNRSAHEHFMKAAFVVSAAFLGFYLYYHFVVLPISGGPTKFNGAGAAKVAYLVMLLTHVVLAVVNLPMVLRTFWLAHKEDWERHKRMARWTLPIWLYVSVTGVLVYLVLYPFNPPAGV